MTDARGRWQCMGRILAAVGLASTWVGAGMVVVRDGEPSCSIVLPGSPSDTLQQTAAILREYIGKITGATLPIRPETGPADRFGIHLGDTLAARERLKGMPLEDSDGFAIGIDQRCAAIRGGSDRGTRFGVYRFLEEFLGCRWLAPDLDYVPKRSTLELAPVRRTFVPAFDMRVFKGTRESSAEWGIKMGMNGFFTKDTAERAGGCFYLPRENPGCHSYSRIIPAERYFDTHPEWFPLIDGTRRPGKVHGSQLCVTAPGLADEFAANVIALFDANPTCRAMSISPNDGRGWCDCSVCSALDKKLCGGRKTRQGLAAERPFRGDRVFWFANQVARRVARRYPDKLLFVLAYINYAEPPDTVVPLPNVVPWLCHYAPADYSRSIADPASEANAQFDRLLRKWAVRAPHLLFYSYVSKSMWWRLPRPIMRNFSADLKYLHSLGVRRYYCQSGLNDWVGDGPLHYVLARLLWDPTLDPGTIAQDWLEHMFGAAAPSMRAYYASLESAVAETGRPYSDNPPSQVPGLFSRARLDEARERLTEALDSSDDPEVRDRITRITGIFDYGCAMIRGIEAWDEYKKDMAPEAAAAARRNIEEALRLYNRREARRYLETLRITERFGVVASGWGDEERKGDRPCWNSDETGPGDEAAGWAMLALRIPDGERGLRLKMCVWGESDLSSIVVNTGGEGRSYAAGGIWTPVSPRVPLRKKPSWQWLEFTVPAALLPKAKEVVRVGMGGGDTQIWVSEVQVLDEER